MLKKIIKIFNKDLDTQLVIKNFKFENLKPIRKKFKNKNNKFSAQAYLNNQKVKIYEVFDKNQGHLRKFISQHNKLSTFFPKLITYDDKYIVEEWLDGKTLKEIKKINLIKSKYSKEVIEIIKLMWATNYDSIVFDYIDYIHKRINKKNNFDTSNIPRRINHNDLSLENILITPKGLKIIDNEFLGCNTGWILNIKNSFLDKDFLTQDFIADENLKKLWKIRKEWSTYHY